MIERVGLAERRLSGRLADSGSNTQLCCIACRPNHVVRDLTSKCAEQIAASTLSSCFGVLEASDGADACRTARSNTQDNSEGHSDLSGTARAYRGSCRRRLPDTPGLRAAATNVH